MPTPCTWNPSDIGSSVSLSNGNLTFASTNSGAHCGRATTGILAGSGGVNASLLKYFEVTAVAVGATANLGLEIGVANETQALNNFLGSGGASTCLESKAGSIFYNGSVFFTWFTVANADIVGVAVDFLHQKLWWTKNGTTWNNGVIGAQNPASNTGGFTSAVAMFNNSGYKTIYPAFGARQTGTGATLNAGASPFAYTPPSGFSAWDATTAFDPTKGMFLLAP